MCVCVCVCVCVCMQLCVSLCLCLSACAICIVSVSNYCVHLNLLLYNVLHVIDLKLTKMNKNEMVS